MKIKVEPFGIKKGNRVGRGMIELEDGFLSGWHIIGFTICEEDDKLFVLFPSTKAKNKNANEKDFNFYFLKPPSPDQVEKLEEMILDIYEKMVDSVKA